MYAIRSYYARDPELDRTVAVKIPRKDQLSPAEVEQFERQHEYEQANSRVTPKYCTVTPYHERNNFV